MVPKNPAPYSRYDSVFLRASGPKSPRPNPSPYFFTNSLFCGHRPPIACVVCVYGETRHQDGPPVVRGYLVADAATIYDPLYSGDLRTEVGCWAHVRRYFVKTISSDPERSRKAIEWIGELFHIESEHTKSPPEKRKRHREERSAPIVETFFEWCTEERSKPLDDSPMKAALTYALNQQKALERFLTDGRLPLHNNASENALPQASGGQKKLAVRGKRGRGRGQCPLRVSPGVLPTSRNRTLVILAGPVLFDTRWPKNNALQLAPVYWKETATRPEVKAKLQKNPFRRINEAYVGAVLEAEVATKNETTDDVNDAVR
ncbi:MAG: transposase [Myxococcales bacterium]|nr:transposase [Myxococcales bacterium]